MSNYSPVRVYCDGIYDLFHFGHARSLEQAKLAFPSVHLIVGVCNDSDTLAYKGPTVMTQSERIECVKNCSHVDQVAADAPWIVDQTFLDKYAIDYVAHDEMPYACNGTRDVYGFVKSVGKFVATKRTEGISTTDLISRILRQREELILRNLKRGIDRKRMNVSLVYAKWLLWKDWFSNWFY